MAKIRYKIMNKKMTKYAVILVDKGHKVKYIKITDA